MTAIISQCPADPHGAACYRDGVRNGIALVAAMMPLTSTAQAVADVELEKLARHVLRLMRDTCKPIVDDPAPETERSRA